MAKIAFFCIPAHGHINPTLGVVQQLTERGHEVRYYAFEPFRQQLEQAGACFIPCDAYAMEQKLSPSEAARMGKDLALSTRVLVDTTLALDQQMYNELQNWRPDCIVADSMAVWGKALARKLAVPFVSSTTTLAFNQHSAQMMKRGIGELFGMLFSLPKIRHEISRLQKHGYPIHSVLDILQNDNQTHTIVFTSAAFQPFSNTFSPSHYAFVGPSLRPSGSPPCPIRHPMIFLSMGTVDNDRISLYREAIAAFTESPYQVILSAGSHTDCSQLGNLPDNIRVFPHVDQPAVLQEADAFITHCGMNSVMEALYFGVPLLMLPQTAEQYAVARRAAELGAGIILKRPRQADICKALHLLTSCGEYRQNAQRLSENLRSCPGARGAADKILSVIAAQK